jgi:anti-sigma28 factor (negative regulator of flagellin synthesis)
MTSENTGSDPVFVLYHRALQDLENIKDLQRFGRLTDPCFPAERGPKAKECWALFDSSIETYQWALSRFDESAKLDRDIRQQPQVGELIFRTRATQRRQPFIEDAKAYLDKSRKLYRYLLEGLAPVKGKRTIKAYLDKVDDCRALWMKYGFDIEEIEAIPGLIDDLRTEFALICVDRKPTYSATQQDRPKEQQTKVAEPTKPRKKWGRPKADWTQEDKKIIELSRQGMKPQEIASKLRLPNLVTEKRIRALKRRIKDGNPPK